MGQEGYTKVEMKEVTETVVVLSFEKKYKGVVEKRMSVLKSEDFTKHLEFHLIDELPIEELGASIAWREVLIEQDGATDRVFVEIRTTESGRLGMWNGPIEHSICYLKGEYQPATYELPKY